MVKVKSVFVVEATGYSHLSKCCGENPRSVAGSGEESEHFYVLRGVCAVYMKIKKKNKKNCGTGRCVLATGVVIMQMR